VKTVDEALEVVKMIPEIDRSECRRIVEGKFNHHRMVEAYHRVYHSIIEKEKREEKRPWGGYKALGSESSFQGNVILVDTENSFVYSNNGRLIGVLGLKDALIVGTDDVLLISNLQGCQELKQFPEILGRRGWKQWV